MLSNLALTVKHCQHQASVKRGGSEAEWPDRAGVFPAAGIRQIKGLEFGISPAESKT
jgi:hypothetical protein